MNIAMGLAAGRAPGTRVNLEALVPASGDLDATIAAANRAILNETASGNTLRTMESQTRDLEPAAARVMIVGLALGSPEFQKQ
jgi:hypothetical protein